jgi:hypothetical protein
MLLPLSEHPNMARLLTNALRFDTMMFRLSRVWGQSVQLLTFPVPACPSLPCALPAFVACACLPCATAVTHDIPTGVASVSAAAHTAHSCLAAAVQCATALTP